MPIKYEDIAKEFDYPTYENAPIDVSSFGELSEQIGNNQQGQMDWMNQYMYSPETSESLSSHISTLLDPYSSYIQEARSAAEKQAEEAGYLKSSMAGGAGEASAIDSVFNIAYGNMQSEMYNAYTKNYQSAIQYNTARQAAMAAFNQQFELGAKDVYANIYDQFKDRQQQFQLEQQDHAALYKSYQDFNQASYELDLTQYAKTEERLRQQLKDKAGVLAHYMDSFNQVVVSDMNEEDKYARLNALITETEALLNRGELSIEESPYQIEDIYGKDTLLGPSPTEGIFKWDYQDAVYEYQKLDETMRDIYFKIHEASSHEERNYYGPYSNLQRVMDYLPAVQRINPEAFTSIIQWYDRVGKEQMQDDWEGAIRILKELMGGALAESQYPYAASLPWKTTEIIDSENGWYISQVSTPRWDLNSQSIVYDVYEQDHIGRITKIHTGLPEPSEGEWQVNWDVINQMGEGSIPYIQNNYQQADYQPILDYADSVNYDSLNPEQQEYVKGVFSLLANDLLMRLEPNNFFNYLPNFPDYEVVYAPFGGQTVPIHRFTSYQSVNGVVTGIPYVGVTINGDSVVVSEEQALKDLYTDCVNNVGAASCTQASSLDSYR